MESKFCLIMMFSSQFASLLAAITATGHQLSGGHVQMVGDADFQNILIQGSKVFHKTST